MQIQLDAVTLIDLIFLFVIAIFLGVELIAKVPSILHTPPHSSKLPSCSVHTQKADKVTHAMEKLNRKRLQPYLAFLYFET